MSEASPIARALLGGECDCEPKCTDRMVSCAICGAQTTCLAFIWHAVKLWNHAEGKAADAERRPVQYIRPTEMGIACEGECTATLFRQRHHDVQEEHATTNAYLSMLARGLYNPESLAWLRKHGCSRQVNRTLAEEGNRSHE